MPVSGRFGRAPPPDASANASIAATANSTANRSVLISPLSGSVPAGTSVYRRLATDCPPARLVPRPEDLPRVRERSAANVGRAPRVEVDRSAREEAGVGTEPPARVAERTRQADGDGPA